MSTTSDLEAAITLATEIADAIIPFTPAAEFTPLVAAVGLLAQKIVAAAATPTAQNEADVAVAGIEAAADAAEDAKFPKAGP